MFTIGGSSGVILGNAGIDLGLHDTYYVPGHFHFVLSLGGVSGIFSGILYFGENIVGYKNLLPSSSCTLSLYHLVLTFIGIALTFSSLSSKEYLEVDLYKVRNRFLVDLHSLLINGK